MITIVEMRFREGLLLNFLTVVSNPLDCVYHLLPFDNRDQLME